MRKVSDYLKEERLRKKISLEDVSRATNIKRKYLEYIEDGKFGALPSRSYVVGFVKTYASYLGLSQPTVFAFLRREYGEEHLEVIPQYRKKQPKIKQPFFTNSKIILASITIFIVGIYIVFQYSAVLFGPELVVTFPKNGQIIKDNILRVGGKTNPYATVSINDSETYVDITGNFRKLIYVFSGRQKITVIAKSRFGKQTQKVITVKVE